jgi:hypothetical protein
VSVIAVSLTSSIVINIEPVTASSEGVQSKTVDDDVVCDAVKFVAALGLVVIPAILLASDKFLLHLLILL